MKKAGIIAGAAVIVMVLGAGSVYAAGQIAKNTAIGENSALNFACVDAGVDPKDVTVKSNHFDFENGRFVYELEFYAGDSEYDYDIDAYSGSVVSKSYEKMDMDDYAEIPMTVNIDVFPETERPQENTAPQESPAPGENRRETVEENITPRESPAPQENIQETVSQENIAPQENVPAQVNPAPQESIPAQVNPAPQENTASTSITLEDAKSIALGRAGQTYDNVIFSKARQEYDDGILKYEIEFYVPGAGEYEYEIAAGTGAIIEEDYEPWEYDIDD